MLTNRYKIKGVDFKHVIVKKEIKKPGKKSQDEPRENLKDLFICVCVCLCECVPM